MIVVLFDLRYGRLPGRIHCNLLVFILLLISIKVVWSFAPLLIIHPLRSMLALIGMNRLVTVQDRILREYVLIM